MTRLLALLLGCGLLLAPAVRAADAPSAAPEARRGYLTFYLDNDLFAGTDRNYTNGARFSWISEGEPLVNVPMVRDELERLATADVRMIRALSGFREESLEQGTLELNYGLSLTQLMFTPEDFTALTQPPGQRRYAGWLGLGFSVHARDDSALNSAELILGTTGPNSLAEEAQDFIHDVRDFDKFRGWDAQIPNEVTLDLVFTQKRRIRILDRQDFGFSIDGLAEGGTRLGTFRTDAFVGGFFRAGLNLAADFSDPRVSATSYSHQVFDRSQPGRSGPWSVYALFGFRAAAVAHDATLDGPLFSDFDTGNEREPLVGDVFAGFGARLGPVEFTYAQTFRTKAFEEQRGSTDFGSLAVRVRL
ncbi:MAG: lipid A deacylase LpxR family protein [Pseudomonadales bacterium]|jgi:hypothetical protein|nr:lipid A deacylase LpxR family protein [Pseudomonadales bacterium]